MSGFRLFLLGLPRLDRDGELVKFRYRKNVALTAHMVVDLDSVRTDPSAEPWVDVDQFRELLRAGLKHGHPASDVCAECLSGLPEAVKIYRGDFQAGFSLRDSVNFDDWQFFETAGRAYPVSFLA